MLWIRNCIGVDWDLEVRKIHTDQAGTYAVVMPLRIGKAIHLTKLALVPTKQEFWNLGKRVH